MAKIAIPARIPALVAITVVVSACTTPERGPASLHPCLQAPGLGTTIMLSEESFCPLGYKADKKDQGILDKHIQELDRKHKVSARSDEYAGTSHYTGFMTKYRWAQKAGKPFAGLTKQEMFSLHEYIEWGHQNFNRALWSEFSNNELERAEIRLLTSALNRLPSYRGQVFRGELDSQVTEDLLELDKRISSLIPGQPYFFKGFLGAALPKSKASNPFQDKRVIVYEIKSKSGKLIAPLASRPGAEEVLFRPGTWFQVVDVKKIPKARTGAYALDFQWLVQLEEI